MKFLDFFVNQSFKKDKDGNELFFPWGVFGKGHIIDSLETKQKIQRFLQWYYLVTFSTLFLWGIMINPYIAIQVSLQTQGANRYLPKSDFANNLLWAELPIFLILTVGSFIWWYIGIQPFIKTLPITAVKLTWAEAYKTNAKIGHPFFLWFGLIGSIIFMVATIFLMLQDFPLVFGSISLIFWGLLAVIYVYMIIVRNEP